MNTLSATVANIENSSHLCGLRVSFCGDIFELILVESLALNDGDTVTLAFKETEVILLKTALSFCSANALIGTIISIESGNILTSVTLSYQATTIVSLITTHAYKRLELMIGDEVIWMVQPSEISLLRGHDGI